MHVVVLHVICHPNKHPVVVPLVCQGRCIHYFLFTTVSNRPAEEPVLRHYSGCRRIRATLLWSFANAGKSKAQVTDSITDEIGWNVYLCAQTFSHTYLKAHSKVVLYILKRTTDQPANHIASLWWLIGSTRCPHTISQREEKPSSILIFLSSSIFISSFIFITGYTEQIRELCEHFCRSLFEMEHCYGLADSDTTLYLQVASNLQLHWNCTEYWSGLCTT